MSFAISAHRVSGVMFRYFYLFRHSLDRLSDAIYWPIMDLILWGLTTQWLSGAGPAVPNILLIMLTAIVFWQIVWRANYEISVNLLEEFWNHNLVNLFASPLRLSEWVLGVMAVGAAKSSVTVLVGLIASWALYSLNVFAVGYYFLPFLVSLILFGWCLGFVAAGLIIYFGPRIQALAWMMGFVLAPFSAVYYPLDVLPAWARVIGSALPTTYVFEGMRLILSERELPVRMLALSGVLNLLYLALSLLFFRFLFEKSRAKGLARLD